MILLGGIMSNGKDWWRDKLMGFLIWEINNEDVNSSINRQIVLGLDKTQQQVPAVRVNKTISMKGLIIIIVVKQVN
jgi:hypothetical protein